MERRTGVRSTALAEAPQPDIAPLAAAPQDGVATLAEAPQAGAAPVAERTPTAELPLPGMRSTALPVHVRTARRTRWERLVTVALDAVAIVAGFLLAYWARYELGLSFGRETVGSPLDRFGPALLIMLGSTLTLLLIKGSYRQPRSISWLNQLGSIASSVTTAVGLTIIITFLVRRWNVPSRLIFLYAWVLVFALLALNRRLITAVRRWRWRNGRDLERVLVVGGTGLGREVMATLAGNPYTGYQLIGFVADPPDPDAPPPRFTDRIAAPHLGKLDSLPVNVARHQIDHVIVALPFWQHRALPDVVQMCTRLGIDFDVVPDFYELSFDRITTQELGGTPLIRLRDNRITGANYLIKRALDVALVLLALPIWGTLAVIVALLIKLTSPGPIFYRQTRIGRNNHPFEFLKFRTMVINADELKAELMAQNEGTGPMFKMKDDPRVTPIGRFLRKFSLDEIPNFLSVLRGEMSLVGPRPAIPEEVDQYEPWHMRRLEVMPGVTGLWQITGRSDTSFDEYVRLDIYYTEHWSVWLDLRIMLATIPAVVRGRGAY